MSTPLPPVSKTLKIALNGFILGTKPWRNAFHMGFSVGASVTAADVLDVAAAVAGAWVSDMAPHVHTAISLAQVVATSLESDTAPTSTFTSTGVGLNAGTPLAAGTSLVVSRKTERRFRGGHSRVYLPGAIGEGLTNEEAWSATELSDFVDAWGAVEAAAKDALIANGHTDALPKVVSYFHGFSNVLFPSGRYHVIPTLRTDPIVDTVVAYVGNPKPCSQRRRESAR